MSTTMPAARLPIIVNKNAPSSFYDQITIGGAAVVMETGSTTDFSMRPLTSRTPVISAASAVPLNPPDLDGNNTRYDWAPNDVASEGEFWAWWGFELPNETRQETPEFPIIITDHGPGLGTQTGAVVDGAQTYLPVTFDYLQKDHRFGDRALQQKAELVKMKVLGYTMAPDAEDQLDLSILDFLSKRVALELITPGIDFWSRQMRTATATQTAEVTSYPDIIASLKDLRGRLAQELSEDWREVQLFVPGTPNRRVIPMPASSLGGPDAPWTGFPVTKDPQTTPRLQTGRLGWGFDGVTFPFP